jgi:hypothetical protein
LEYPFLEESSLGKIQRKRQDHAIAQAEQDKTQAIINAYESLSNEVRSLLGTLTTTGARKFEQSFVDNVKSLERVAERLSQIRITSDEDIKTGLTELAQLIRNLEVKPVVNVKPADIRVEEKEIDFTPLVETIKQLEVKAPDVIVDTKGLAQGIQKVHKAINDLKFPVSNYILPFKNSDGKSVQLELVGGGIPIGHPSSVTVTSVDDTASSTQLVAANNSRQEIEFVNNSTSILYLLKGSGTATATNYSVLLEQGDYYSTDFKGAFQGVWSVNSSGTILITEST